jgi:hypothetical protein
MGVMNYFRNIFCFSSCLALSALSYSSALAVTLHCESFVNGKSSNDVFYIDEKWEINGDTYVKKQIDQWIDGAPLTTTISINRHSGKYTITTEGKLKDGSLYSENSISGECEDVTNRKF